MATPVFPPLMSKKIGLSSDPSDAKAPNVTAAFLRSRRHKSPEKMPENTIAVAYELNQDERSALAAGAILYVAQVTYGNAPNEQLLHVGTDVAAEYYAVEEATPELLTAARHKAEDELGKAVEKFQAALRECRTVDGQEHDASEARRVEGGYAKTLHRLGEALEALGQANVQAGYGAT